MRLHGERPWSRRSLAQESGPLAPLLTGWVNHSTSLEPGVVENVK